MFDVKRREKWDVVFLINTRTAEMYFMFVRSVRCILQTLTGVAYFMYANRRRIFHVFHVCSQARLDSGVDVVIMLTRSLAHSHCTSFRIEKKGS